MDFFYIKSQSPRDHPMTIYRTCCWDSWDLRWWCTLSSRCCQGGRKKTRCVSERLFSRWKRVVFFVFFIEVIIYINYLRTVMVWDQETWFSFMGLKECPKPAIPPPRTEVRSPWDGLMEVKSGELPSRLEPHIIEALKPFKTSRLSNSDWVQGKISNVRCGKNPWVSTAFWQVVLMSVPHPERHVGDVGVATLQETHIPPWRSSMESLRTGFGYVWIILNYDFTTGNSRFFFSEFQGCTYLGCELRPSIQPTDLTSKMCSPPTNIDVTWCDNMWHRSSKLRWI